MVGYHFGFAVTPCVHLDHREAEVQVLKRTLSHYSYLDSMSKFNNNNNMWTYIVHVSTN